MVLHSAIKITLIEKRMHDAWLDFSKREMREGQVNYYKAKDPVTGEWMFKVCRDSEMRKLIVKAVKCPPGKVYSQLEGDTMVFQPSMSNRYLYDIISLTYRDESGRIRRRMLDNREQIPRAIIESFHLQKHKAATGKNTSFAEHLVTLTQEDDLRSPIVLFLIERAWQLSAISPQQAIETANEKQRFKHNISNRLLDVLSVVKNLEKASMEEVMSRLESELQLRRDDATAIVNGLLKEGRLRKVSTSHLKVTRSRRISQSPNFVSTLSESNAPLARIAASST